MSSVTYIPATWEALTAAFAEPTRIELCRTDAVGVKEAYHLAHAIGGYNGYNADLVGVAIANIGHMNPWISFRLGREYSPVLYVYLPEGAQPDLAARVTEMLERVTGPSELETLDASCIRAWWD